MTAADMASVATLANINNGGTSAEEEAPKKATYKSFKKKFLKIKHVFREKMRESNNLFDEEQRLVKLARRLQEQNDQLLELLLDVNESNKIPPHLRYDLDSAPPSPSSVPPLSPDRDRPNETTEITEAQAALDEARMELRSGQITLEAFKEIEGPLSAIIRRAHSLPYLSKVSHSALRGEKAVPSERLPTDLAEESPAEYLSPTHEEDYLTALDNYLDTAPANASPIPPKPKISEREREREIQLHNPMSVFNWLQKHRHIFIDQSSDDHPNPKEKPASSSSAKQPSSAGGATGSTAQPSTSARKSSPKASTAPTRSTKRDRASTSAAVKQEREEMLDDEGYVIGGTGVPEVPEGRKRKRGKEDEAYRPKGGTSRPSKRKRASTGVRSERRMEVDDD